MFYDAALIECLCNSINNMDTDNTIKLTSIFISRCINQGWSARALYQKIDSNKDDINTFLNKIFNSQKQNYAVLFSLSKKPSFRWAFCDKSGKIEAGDRNDREKQKKERTNGNIQHRGVCTKESSA